MIQTIRPLELLELNEQATNVLRVVVAELISQAEAEIELIEGFKITGRPMIVAKDSRVFQLVWSDYVAYTVTNETYALPDAEVSGTSPHFSNEGFREYEASSLLEHLKKVTRATNNFPGPLRHWCVCCSWHVIDVVSCDPPQITQTAGPVET